MNKRKIIKWLLWIGILLFVFVPIMVLVQNSNFFKQKIEVIDEPNLQEPQDVSGIQLQDGSNLLAWSEVKGAQAYKIYKCSPNGEDYKQIGSSTGTFYLDSKMNSGQVSKYYMVASCKDKNGKECCSGKSDIVTVNPPKPTQKLTPAALPTLLPRPTAAPTKTPISKTPSKTPITSKPTSSSFGDYKQEVLKLINAEREKAGVQTLRMPDMLLAPADKRAVEIESVFSHTRPDGTNWYTVFGEYQISPHTMGENIAYGQQSPQQVVTAWMNSPGHRKNILDPEYNRVGIGVQSKGGNLYWTQLFMN